MDKTDLPQKFWELPEWNRYYRQQIVAANKLLKEYRGEAIALALKSPGAWNIFSLRAPHLLGIIVTEENKLKRRDAIKPTVSQRSSTVGKPRQPQPNRAYKQLRDLDG